MIAVLAPAIILLQYYLTVRHLQQRRYPELFGVVLFAMVSYDWVFIHASYLLPRTFVGFLKPYFEYLTAFLAFMVLRRSPGLTIFNTQARQFLLLLFPALIVILLNDLTPGRRLPDLLQSLRLFLLPILFLFLLFRYGAFRAVRPAFVVNSLIWVSVLVALAGSIQKLGYKGDVRDLWFFDYFKTWFPHPVLAGKANYVRNDSLRVTGIFVSPITQTIALGIGVVLLAARQIFEPMTLRKRAWGLFLMVALVYGQWQTSTRVGLIMDALGIAVLLGSRLLPRLRGWLYLIPVAAVGATFASLLSGGVKEESALGRLVQFADLPQFFRVRGLGFSHPMVATYFDSYLITLVLLFGGLIIFPFLFFWKINRPVVQLLKACPRSVLLNATLALCSSFLYLFTFQFIAGSWPYRVYFLLLFYCWFAYEQYRQAKVCPAAADGSVPTNDF